MGYKKYFLLMAVIAAIIVTMIILWKKDNADNLTANATYGQSDSDTVITETPGNNLPEEAASNQRVTNRHSEVNRPKDVIGVLELEKNIWRAKTAEEYVEQMLSQPDYNDNLLQDRLAGLDDSCLSVDVLRDHSITSDGRKWLYEKLAVFCGDSYIRQADFDRSQLSEEELGDKVINSYPAVYARQVRNILLEGGVDETSETFTEILASTEHPEDITALREINYNLPSDENRYAWTIANELKQGDQYNSADANKSQDTALQLYGCQRFGGCGPDDYFTIVNCIALNGCEPGWSLEDYIFNTTSPVDYALAQAILSELAKSD